MEYNPQYDRERMLANAQYSQGYSQQGYPQQGYPQQGYPQQGYPQFDYYGNEQGGYSGQMVQAGTTMPSNSQVTYTVNTLLEKTGFSKTHPEYLTLKIPDVFHGVYKKCMNRKTSKEPVQTICTKCNQPGFTRPISEVGFGTVVCSASTCICCPLFFWCPFLVDECYDHSHVCPSCGNVIIKERFLIG